MKFSYFLIVVLYFIVAYKYWKRSRDSNDPFFFFVITFGFFTIPRFLITLLIEDFDIAQGTWIYWAKADDSVVMQTVLLLAIFMINLFINNKEFTVKKSENLSNKILGKASICLLAFFSPFVIYRGILVASSVSSKGYLATFTSEVSVPFFINVAYSIFQLAFFFFLASFPNRKQFFRVSFFYLFVVIFTIGSGQRTEFIISVLLIYWAGLFFEFYKLNLKKLFLLAIPLIFLSIVINAWRTDTLNLGNVYFEILQFFWGQGVTLTVIFGTLENHHLFSFFEGFFFWNKCITCDLLPYVTGKTCQNGQYVSTVLGVWWQKLCYILDPDLFSMGGGLGGSIVSALYLFFNSKFFLLNAFIFSGVSFFFIRVIYKMQYLIERNLFFRVYFFYFVSSLFFSPRSGLDIFIPHPRFLVAGGFIYLFYLLLKKWGVENE